MEEQQRILMTDFTEIFSTYSNSELLKIIDNPTDYQPLAVVTAQNIIASRHLSELEIETAQLELAAIRREKETKIQKKKDIEIKVKNFGASLLSEVNPIQTEIPNSDKIIKIISLISLDFHFIKSIKISI